MAAVKREKEPEIIPLYTYIYIYIYIYIYTYINIFQRSTLKFMVHTSWWHSLCRSIGNTDSVVVAMVLVMVVLEVLLVVGSVVTGAVVKTSNASVRFPSRPLADSVWANVSENVSNMKYMVYIAVIFLKITWKTKADNWWWWWWIVFAWLTDKKHQALFPARTIVRDPHPRESLTCHKQDLNLCKTWVHDLLHKVVQ